MLFGCTKFTLIVLALSLAVSALGNYIFPSKSLTSLIIFLGIISFIVKINKTILTVILLFVSMVLISEFIYRVKSKISYGYSYYVEQSIYQVTQAKSILIAIPLAIVAVGLLIYLCKIYFSEDMNIIEKSSLNLDPIHVVDQEWITEIKTRKQKGEKLNAYSKDGAAAARRKARALGIEECFVEFLSEEEIKERRGW